METLSPLQHLFGKSPFKAIQQHMMKVVETVELLPALTTAMVEGKQGETSDLVKKIEALTMEGNAMVQEVFLHLPKSLFMPVDRRDLLEIINLNDEVAWECLRLAHIMESSSLQWPAAVADGLKSASTLCMTVVQQARKIIEELDELVETGFGGREARLVLGLIDELAKTKMETDRLLWNLARQVMAEGEKTPLMVIHTTRLLDEMAKIPHAAGKAGNRMRLLLAR